MNQAPILKPSLKDYIIENWNTYKMKSLRELKKELIDTCILPVDNEMTIF